MYQIDQLQRTLRRLPNARPVSPAPWSVIVSAEPMGRTAGRQANVPIPFRCDPGRNGGRHVVDNHAVGLHPVEVLGQAVDLVVVPTVRELQQLPPEFIEPRL